MPSSENSQARRARRDRRDRPPSRGSSSSRDRFSVRDYDPGRPDRRDASPPHRSFRSRSCGPGPGYGSGYGAMRRIDVAHGERSHDRGQFPDPFEYGFTGPLPRRPPPADLPDPPVLLMREREISISVSQGTMIRRPRDSVGQERHSSRAPPTSGYHHLPIHPPGSSPSNNVGPTSAQYGSQRAPPSSARSRFYSAHPASARAGYYYRATSPPSRGYSNTWEFSDSDDSDTVLPEDSISSVGRTTRGR